MVEAVWLQTVGRRICVENTHELAFLKGIKNFYCNKIWIEFEGELFTKCLSQKDLMKPLHKCDENSYLMIFHVKLLLTWMEVNRLSRRAVECKNNNNNN